MPPEGMVHALRRATDLTAPFGTVIDLHPTPDVAQLAIVFPDGTAETIGIVHSETAVERHANADAAIATALSDGFVERERADTFIFSRYCESLDELAAYVETKWTAWFDAVTLDKARAQLRPACRLRLSKKYRYRRCANGDVANAQVTSRQ